MTTGSKILSRFTTTPEGFTIGLQASKSWTGSDAVTPATPRESFRTGARKPARDALSKPKKKKRLLFPPQPYSVTGLRHQRAVHLVRKISTGMLYKVNYCDIPAFPGLFRDPAQEYKVMDKLRKDVYGSGFSPAVFLAEAPQALGLIGNAAVRIGEAIAAFRARDARALFIALGIRAPRKKFASDLKNQSKDASSLWLEVQYGWRPLLSDAEEGAIWIAEALNGHAAGKTRLVRSRDWQETSIFKGPLQSTVSYTQRDSFYGYKVIATGVAALSQNRPTLMTVAEVAWEKLPWSFVIDWWVPIGAYLSALKTAGDISGTFVETRKARHVYSGIKSPPSYFYISEILGLEGREEFRMARTVTKEIKVTNPFSGILDKDQGYKSLAHAANAVALIISGGGKVASGVSSGWRGRNTYTE